LPPWSSAVSPAHRGSHKQPRGGWKDLGVVAEIIWTAEAQRWLQEIYDYIAEDNETAAYRTVRGIYERAQILLTFPEIGYRYRDRPDVRVLLYGHYRIAYLVTTEGNIDSSGCSTARWTFVLPDPG
jgi:toxin ParE1/3/4